VVHLSTSSVYDAFTPTVEVSESVPPARRFLSSYSASKTVAELELAGVDAAILRPHAVYGPGDTTLLPRLLAAVRRGRLVLPEGAQVRHSLTHIDNLVLAVRRALDPASPAGTYNIADDTPVTAVDLHQLNRIDLPPALYDRTDPDPWLCITSTARIRRELGYRPLYPSVWTALDAGAL